MNRMNLIRKINIGNYINPNVKKIYLHAGLMKTATSSIQESLAENKDFLDSLGYFTFKYYDSNLSLPIHSLFSRGFKNSPHHVNVQWSVWQIYGFNYKSLLAILDEIKQTSCENVIISADWISALLKTSELKELNKFLNKIMPNADIDLVVYLRERKSYASSIIQQHIRSNYSDNNNIFDTDYGRLYQNSLKKLIKVFGREKVFAYKFEDSLKNDRGPVGYFAEAIGIAKEDIEKMKIVRTNESLSDMAIDIIKYIDKQVPYIIKNKVSVFRTVRDTWLFHDISGDKFKLDSETLRKINEDGQKDTEWLKNNFNIQYPRDYQEESPLKELVFDNRYYDELTALFSKMNPIIRKLVYSYLIEKKNECSGEETNKTINRALSWIEENFEEDISISLEQHMQTEKNKYIKPSFYKKIIDYIVYRNNLDEYFLNAETYLDLAIENFNKKRYNIVEGFIKSAKDCSNYATDEKIKNEITKLEKELNKNDYEKSINNRNKWTRRLILGRFIAGKRIRSIWTNEEKKRS